MKKEEKKYKYPESELEASLRRAFVDKRFESILLDGHEMKNPFIVEGINYGIDKGWLQVKEEIKESQYTAINYKLTEKGKKYFKVEEAKV